MPDHDQSAPTSAGRKDAKAATQTRSAPPGQELTGAEGIWYLQRAAGNGAVGSLLARMDSSRAVPTLPRNGNGAWLAAVQRQVGAAVSAVWNAPLDFGAIPDAGAARTAVDQLLLEIAGFAQTGIDEVTTGYTKTQQDLTSAKDAIAASGALQQSDADTLNALTGPFNFFYQGSTALVKQRLIASLRQVQPLDAQTDDITGTLDDALHEVYVKPDKDKLEDLKNALEQVKGLAEKGKKAADWATAAAGDLETAIKIFEVGEKLEKTADFIGNITTAIDAGKGLFTIVQNQYGEDKGGDLGTIDSLEAGLDLSTMAGKSFMEAVPLFGQYWNGYVVPVAKLCMTQARHIIQIKDQINLARMNQLIQWNPTPDGGWELSPDPPELGPSVYESLEGKRPVFEYLYLTRVGSQPAMNDDVEKYFITNREKLGWGESEGIETTRAWYKPWTWFQKNKAPHLPEWIAAHIVNIWASLYGHSGMFRP